MKRLYVVLILLLGLLAPVAPPCLANPPNEAINLNNAGVKALNNKNWQLAVDKFREAIKLDSTYGTPKDNLIIGQNWWGDALIKEHKPEEALKHFHQALYLKENWHAAENIADTIKAMGKNPRSFADRIALGDQAKSDGDLVGAAVEYDAAVRIKNEPGLHGKIADIYRQLGEPEKAAAEEIPSMIGRHGYDPILRR
jgi:tetratricopeptide (TPR) repeat protein